MTRIRKPIALLSALACSVMLQPGASFAQSFGSLKTSPSRLSLASVGSFYVGGKDVTQSAAQTGLYGGGELPVDQMYVQFMVPAPRGKPSVVLVHGATLSGKSYETTPDGRMGWYEYFVRRGFPTYVVDQVGRARSGFDQSTFNEVRSGKAEAGSQPALRRLANDVAWVRFRFGPKPGVKYQDSQFPVEAAKQFAMQAVPDLTQSFPPADPNWPALSDLAKQLKGTVLVGHSQAGRYPFETALLDPTGLKALIAVEPAGCKGTQYTSEQIAQLSKLPILIVFGDHLDTAQEFGANWNDGYKDCQAFEKRIREAGGRVQILYPPDLGIHGNSHMIMQDKNNLKIADLIIRWIDQNTR